MRILFCTNRFEQVTNGPAKFAKNLSSHSGSEDIRFFILTEDVKQSSNNVFKIKINLPKPLRYFSQFYRMIKYMIESNKLDKNYSFDYIVYNNALIGSLHCLFSKKVIGMVNDENNIKKRFKNSSLRRFSTKYLIFYFFEKIAVKNMKHIIVNSNYLKNTIEGTYNVSNCHVLNKGIEEELVESFSEKIIQKKERGTICFMKADYSRGGIYTLLESLKYLNFEYKLTIVGVPSKDKHLFRRYNFSHITWVDRLSQNEAFRLLEKTEIFCNPALSEAFGVANLEAIALGCKVVTTKVGGIPEALYGYENVKLILPNDPRRLADSINSIYNSSYLMDERLNKKLKNSSYLNVFPNFIKIIKNLNE